MRNLKIALLGTELQLGPGFQSKQSKTGGEKGRFRGRNRPVASPAPGRFAAPGSAGAGSGLPQKTAPNVGFLRGFTAPPRRQRKAPAGSKPVRRKRHQSAKALASNGAGHAPPTRNRSGRVTVFCFQSRLAVWPCSTMGFRMSFLALLLEPESRHSIPTWHLRF